MQLINPNMPSNELNTKLMPHSIIHGNACFAYFSGIVLLILGDREPRGSLIRRHRPAEVTMETYP